MSAQCPLIKKKILKVIKAKNKEENQIIMH